MSKFTWASRDKTYPWIPQTFFFKNELVDGSMVLLTRTSVETKPLKGQLKVPGQRCWLYFDKMSLVVFVQHFTLCWKSQIWKKSYMYLNWNLIKSNNSVSTKPKALKMIPKSFFKNSFWKNWDLLPSECIQIISWPLNGLRAIILSHESIELNKYEISDRTQQNFWKSRINLDQSVAGTGGSWILDHILTAKD